MVGRSARHLVQAEEEDPDAGTIRVGHEDRGHLKPRRQLDAHTHLVHPVVLGDLGTPVPADQEVPDDSDMVVPGDQEDPEDPVDLEDLGGSGTVVLGGPADPVGRVVPGGLVDLEMEVL